MLYYNKHARVHYSELRINDDVIIRVMKMCPVNYLICGIYRQNILKTDQKIYLKEYFNIIFQVA